MVYNCSNAPQDYVLRTVHCLSCWILFKCYSPSVPRYWRWSRPYMFTDVDVVHIFHLSHVCCVHHPFDHDDHILFILVTSTNDLRRSSLYSFLHLLLLYVGSNIYPCLPVPTTLSMCFTLIWVRSQKKQFKLLVPVQYVRLYVVNKVLDLTIFLQKKVTVNPHYTS